MAPRPLCLHTSPPATTRRTSSLPLRPLPRGRPRSWLPTSIGPTTATTKPSRSTRWTPSTSTSTAVATWRGSRRRRSTRCYGCSAELLDALLDVAAERGGDDLGDLRLDLAAEERDVHLQVA